MGVFADLPATSAHCAKNPLMRPHLRRRCDPRMPRFWALETPLVLCSCGADIFGVSGRVTAYSRR